MRAGSSSGWRTPLVLLCVLPLLTLAAGCGDDSPASTDAGSGGGGGTGGGGGGGGGGDADAGTPTLTVDDASAQEGNSGATAVNFTVTLSAAAASTVTVDYATADGTATAGSDYVAASGTLTFAPGTTTQTITLSLNGDLLNEADEGFTLTLANPAGATLVEPTASGTIQNDDALPSLSLADVSGAEGSGSLAFDVILSAPSGRTVTVAFATSTGTATSADYTAANGTLTFAPGDTSKTVTVSLAGDALDEDDEAFTVDLSAATNATVSDAQATGTITDDDAEPALSVAGASVAEGDSGSTTLTMTVTLSAASGRAVTVGYATGGGTATAGADYTAASGTLTFAAGDTSEPIAVTVAGDADFEADETLTVTLSNAANATLSVPSSTGTILNDDAQLPAFSVSDPTVTEGNSGSATLTFTVTASIAPTSAATVSYATSPGTALSTGTASSGGDDYEDASGTLTFGVGETTKTVSVTVNGDLTFEPDQVVNLDLGNATAATISDSRGQGTITNDDAAPSLTINDVSSAEGNAGTQTVALTISLSGPSEQPVTVDYATADDAAKSAGSAGAGESDFVAASGTATFASGATSQFVPVTLNGDLLDEPAESFFVNLTNAQGATVTDAQGVFTITNDDTPPALSIDDLFVHEADAGHTDHAFTVSLSAPSGRQVRVSYNTTNGSATAPSDYVADAGILSFSAGETSKQLNVAVTGDLTVEPNETFQMNLSAPVNATLADDAGTCTIYASDNPTPQLNINNVAVQELDGGDTTVATLTVTLTGTTAQTVTVDYSSVDGGTATWAVDYQPDAGALSFAPGETSKQISFVVIGDDLDEANEASWVALSNAANADIQDGLGEITINDDDPTPSLSIDDVTIKEGDGGTTTLGTFTVTLSAPSGRSVTVNYATSDGTATAAGSASTGGQDYGSKSAALTFAPGETSKTIDVTVKGDDLNEANVGSAETFNVTLSAPANATLADGAGVGTITEDDPAPTLSIADSSVVEGNLGFKAMQFVVTLSAPAGRQITVSWATADSAPASASSAAIGGDYQAATGTLTFAPSETQKVLSVQIVGDNTDESDETFRVNLSNAAPAAVTLTDSQATGTITDDDGL